MSNKNDIILKELFKVFTKKENNGFSFTRVSEWEQYRKFLTFLKLLSLEENKIKRKLEYMRYHFESFTEAMDILVLLQKQNTPDYELFIKLLYEKLDEIQSNSCIEKYTLYYPINITTLKSKINEFRIGDIAINILSYLDAKNDIDDETLENEVFKPEGIDKTKHQYAKVTVWSRNVGYAQRKVTQYVNLLLCFISYSKKLKKTSTTFSGPSKPLIELELNYIFVFKNNAYYVHHHFEDTSRATEFYNLEDTDIENLNLMLTQFNGADRKIKEIINNSMNQYCLGLREKIISSSFLSFWTSLEILTLKEKSLPHNEVKNRLKSVIKMNDIHEYQIERLYKLRNKLVHTGNHFEITQFDRNLMKGYVEKLFEFFMFNFSKYSYSEIDASYEYLRQDVASLNELEESASLRERSLINKVIQLKTSSQ